MSSNFPSLKSSLWARKFPCGRSTDGRKHVFSSWSPGSRWSACKCKSKPLPSPQHHNTALSVSSNKLGHNQQHFPLHVRKGTYLPLRTADGSAFKASRQCCVAWGTHACARLPQFRAQIKTQRTLLRTNGVLPLNSLNPALRLYPSQLHCSPVPGCPASAKHLSTKKHRRSYHIVVMTYVMYASTGAV